MPARFGVFGHVRALGMKRCGRTTPLTANVQRSTFNAQHSTAELRCCAPTFDVRCYAFRFCLFFQSRTILLRDAALGARGHVRGSRNEARDREIPSEKAVRQLPDRRTPNLNRQLARLGNWLACFPMTSFWLVKQEPSSYSWSDLMAEGGTSWTGVRNYAARNNLRRMQKADQVLFYHSGDEKAVVGVAEVTRTAYPDPTATVTFGEQTSDEMFIGYFNYAQVP